MPSNPSTIRIVVLSVPLDVPDGAPLLRCLEALGGAKVRDGNYCWTGECGHCEVAFEASGLAARRAMACCVAATDGLRLTGLSRYLESDLRP